VRVPVALVALALSAAPANADDVRLGKLAYGGSGCPGGSASITLSSGQKALRLLFKQYQVAVGGTGKSFDRKTCNLAIPLHVPQGKSVSILAVEYHGFNRLPPGARAQFSAEYFFAGGRGPIFAKTFDGPLIRAHVISNKLAASSIVWSGCGANVTLRINSSIRVRTRNNARAVASVNAEDVQAALVYQLQSRSCR
jgi:hypothetical protein